MSSVSEWVIVLDLEIAIVSPSFALGVNEFSSPDFVFQLINCVLSSQ